MPSVDVVHPTCVLCLAADQAHGWLVCTDCEHELNTALEELAQLHVELSLATALLPQGFIVEGTSLIELGDGEGGSKAPAGLTPRRSKPGPKSPARDEVIALLDPRQGARGGSIPGVLEDWRRVLAQDIEEPGATFSGSWGPLLRCWWVVDFARDVRKVVKRAQAAVGRLDFASRPVATCNAPRVELTEDLAGLLSMPCGGDIWFRRTNSSVYCASCKRMWGPDRLIEIALEIKDDETVIRMSTAQLADYFETSTSIVRKWVSRSGAIRDEDGLIRLDDLVKYREKLIAA